MGAIASVAPTPARPFHRKRWIAGLIVAFIVGFLLAWFLKKCPQPGAGGGGGGGGSVSGGGGGPASKGSPVKLGQGSGPPGGGGGGGGAGSIRGGGNPPGDGSGDADLPSGTSPSGKPNQGDDPPGLEGTPPDVTGALMKQLNGGDMSYGGKVNDSTPPDAPPPGPVLTAKDFSYDSTGLPRYSSGVQGVASGVATDTVHHKKSTLAAIVTNDSFDSVVTWYKGQVPAGWSAQSMGDIGAVSKALSPQSIMGMLSGASNGKPTDTAAINAAMAGNGDRSVAIFNPPNQTADPRSIMIVKIKGKPTEIMMSKKLQQ